MAFLFIPRLDLHEQFELASWKTGQVSYYFITVVVLMPPPIDFPTFYVSEFS